ncbi:TRAP transporter small permease [Hydrogenophaga sp. NFH-34]|uniref:TRAP transporter small permease n=1 Tax=Hydrogenophaga sp. NFH-34 TaxID=2744446 RepID=UPI001F450074|nr:TRAP transporter small permease [Hydrogenophaga sp. NFH-34]
MSTRGHSPLAIRAMEAFLAFCLLSMVVMVFGNVVLRYGFDSGIMVSEELSRFAFIWLVFVGAVVAMHEGAHLGVDSLVSRLPRQGKLVCLAISQLLIVICCAMFFWGTWRQHEVNQTTMAQVTGLSMIWVFGMGYFSSLGIGSIALHKLWCIVTGRIADDELVAVRESEEETDPDHGAAPVGTQGERA